MLKDFRGYRGRVKKTKKIRASVKTVKIVAPVAVLRTPKTSELRLTSLHATMAPISCILRKQRAIRQTWKCLTTSHAVLN